MLTAIYERQYRKAGTPATATTPFTPGKLVFVYKLDGAPEALAEYKKSKGDFGSKIVDDKGIHRMFSVRFAGQTCPVIKTSKDQFVLDTTELDKLANLTAQYGIDVAKEKMGQPE